MFIYTDFNGLNLLTVASLSNLHLFNLE